MGAKDGKKDKTETSAMMVVAMRTCPICRKQRQVGVTRTPSLAQCRSDAMLVGKWLFPIPLIACCGHEQPATLAKLIWTQPEPGESGLLRIGSKDLPVVAENPSAYAEAISPRDLEEREALWIAQEALWLHYKQEYLYRCQAFFQACWPQPAREMDPWALVDILAGIDMLPDALQSLAKDPAARRHPRGDKKRYLIVKKIKDSVIRDYPPSELERFFHASVTAFIHFALLPGIYSGKWEVADFEKRLGPSVLTFAILTFPLVDKLSYMRTEALLELAGGAASESRTTVQQHARTLQKQLAGKDAALERLSAEVSYTRERLAAAEKKLHESKEENRRLLDRLAAAQQETAESTYARKVKALKSRIGDLEEELKSLRGRRRQGLMRGFTRGLGLGQARRLRGRCDSHVSGAADVSTDWNGGLEGFSELTGLTGLTIGIFGGMRDKRSPENLPCRVIVHDGEKEAEWRGSLAHCDVLVILTQAISHQAMWSIKEYATANEKPVFYSRHSSIPVILRNVARSLSKDRNDSPSADVKP
ncbi:DUF2325 domain-containing protein [Heliobacterium undosum]|uniref:DUF2325 domain-containing protein n=1 Tax=Heliomicrobium undosum TaxID=121734 RepID=A0A845L570_9FIRM|nr:DUF2325 domain-containing protein [Heliomicrobium undosum]MZP29800.1 DUF2325 domain-containing protein [Heliomicrobium undosum]